MPPFSGTVEERKLMSNFLVELMKGQENLSETTRFPPPNREAP
jgi:hypothetical protein